MDPAPSNRSLGTGGASASTPGSGAASVSGSVASPQGATITDASQNGVAPVIKRRSAIACRRCRRMRSKCIHEKGIPPCKSCKEAGIPAEECFFPSRGQPDLDREYRHPRTRADKSSKSGSSSAPKARGPAVGTVAGQRQADSWDGLPPLEDLIDGVNRFTKNYFQLGFVPKELYPDRLRKDHRSTSLFLLLSILSISGRMSPAFIARYGTGVKAAEYFMDRASLIANEEVYQEPTLERCQAFYLLSIAQQGSGLRNKSYINMGIAVRMAILMQLHREETYHVPNHTPELIIRAESARRTIWMLHSQDNLHSGPLSPVNLSAGDITTLLPCNEEDFARGRVPSSRAALDGTPPAIDKPSLIRDPHRSLFATLMQVHHWWGFVGRRAARYSRSSRPWDPESEFSQTARNLQDWEQNLPHEHIWSTFLLKGYKAEGQELAYLSVTMMTRLSNIVLRRPYLIDIIKPDKIDTTKHAFFSSMSNELFRNVRYLYEQIDAQFTNRTADESVGAQIAAFCVYSCGLFSTYLCKYPNICQDKSLVRDGPMMLQRTIGILMECREVWPLAARWAEALEKFSLDPQSASIGNEGSMDDGKDPIPRAIRQLPPLIPSNKSVRPPLPATQKPLPGPSAPVLPRPGAQRHDLPPASTIASPLQSSGAMTPLMSSPAAMNGSYMNNNTPNTQHYNSPHTQHHHSNSSSPHQHPPHFQPPPLPHTLSPHGYQPNPHPNSQMYMSPHQPQQPPMGRPDGLGLLIEAFDSNHPAASAYAVGPGGPALGQFNPQLGPGTDGFEGELQFYIDGAPSSWMSNNAWLDNMQ